MMSRTMKLSILCLATVSLSVLTNITAFAADQNAYRQGNIYLKTVANSYVQCEQQCRGDASCRSWNFVRPSAGSASGICEFNSNFSTPTPSHVSMSGSIRTNVDSMMSRAVSSGASNTIRIGAPIAAAPKVQAPQNQRGVMQRQHMPRMVHAQPQQRPTQLRHVDPRQVNRQAVPQRITPRNANFMRPTARPQQLPHHVMSPQQRMQAPQQHMQAPQQAVPQNERARLTPEQVFQQQQMQSQQRSEYERQAEYQKQQYLMRELQDERQRMQQEYGMNTQTQQVAPQTQIQAQQQRPMMPQQQAPSLYGALHDDLTRNMMHVPRPQTAPDNFQNPDAPLATSRAMPSIPVETMPMNMPAIPSLAGG